jgi:imidazole glycerol-phosphate synthase subunit HisF
MLRPRVTPCLLLSDGGLVKTVSFGSPKYVGDPVNAVKIFNEKEADELVVLDIDATVRGQAPNERLISQFAVECRMPLCYGGGVRTLDQVKRIVGLGVEKISLSAAAMEEPQLITSAAREIGSQSVVVVLDVRRTRNGRYEVFTHNGKRATGVDPVTAAKSAEERGAGEILVNSIDNDGQMKGYELELAAQVQQATRLPMSVLGGAGSLADMKALITRCGVVGAAAGSLFVFKGTYKAVLINYPGQVQKEEIIRAALARRRIST